MSFEKEVELRVAGNNKNVSLKSAANEFLSKSLTAQYSYNFTWMGVPIIQYPQDMISVQEVAWKVKPDLIIETGVARGGSILYNASVLSMFNKDARVLGVDIDIRQHARDSISSSLVADKIKLIQGSSVDEGIFAQVKEYASNFKKVMVILDSNHTDDHVYQELLLYSTLVTKGSYCIVLDSLVEFFPEETSVDRPWGKGNNPYTAIHRFLKQDSSFKIDEFYQNKTLITSAPDGFLIKK